ncbi:MAG: adenylosuccinate lyase [Synergistaceae bacterium]|jgi:adenylosuccinate lyase|nr:adenylosuccinate lyase [Synergistaceae bacterium]
MIDKYCTKEMSRIWSDENKFARWLDVELAVCRAWAEDGVIPASDLEEITGRASFDAKRIAEIEAETQHDVIAFVSNVAENIGPSGRFVHLGLTSSDVIDTAASLLISDALDVLLEAARNLYESLAQVAWKYRHTPCVGRSHGIHAEPTTFGLKFLGFVSEVGRDIERMELARKEIRVCKLSGAVGTYANCPPHIEARASAELGLEPDLVSTQIIQRDRHARVTGTIALYGACLERIALEIRHLQRTEVLEASEPFGKKQKGSSAMPHKKNPILSERVCGLSRLLRAYASSAVENIALWHERDISHSSVERVIWGDSFNLAHYMTNTMKKIVDGLVVNQEMIRRNLDMTKGLLFSGRVLIELVARGMSREEAYSVVQENAMRCWNGVQSGTGESLSDLLEEDCRLSKLKEYDPGGIKKLFDIDFYMKYVDNIFARFTVFGEKNFSRSDGRSNRNAY